jgi:prepilin-type N-terminal cleavage/methylation domain-containing protein
MWSLHPRRAFTLVEIIVVVTIISILSGTVYFAVSEGADVARDKERQADLLRLQAAIELYKLKHTRYPAGCRGAGNWSGEQGTDFACTGGSNQYIIGLVPDFIDRLPVDPRRGGCDTDCGYAYVTNSDGTVYKLIVMNTVGSEVVGYDHPLKSCDINDRFNNDNRVVGLCGITCPDSYCTGANQTRLVADHPCNPDTVRFQKSYAVWGGIGRLRATVSDTATCVYIGGTRFCADERDPLNQSVPPGGSNNLLRNRTVYETTNIICK